MWAGPLSKNRHAVAAINTDTQTLQTVLITWAMLGLPAHTTYRVRDVWAHTDLYNATDSFLVPIVPHDVGFYVLTPL